MKRSFFFSVILLSLWGHVALAQTSQMSFSQDVQVITYKNRSFKFKFNVLNPSRRSSRVTLEVQGASAGIQYANNNQQLIFKSGEISKNVEVLGLIGDLYIDNEIKIKVRLVASDGVSESVLSTRLGSTPSGTKIGDLDGKKLKTIRYTKGLSEYIYSIDKDNLLTLYLLKGRLNKLGTFRLEKDEYLSPFGLRAIDIDENGVEEFVVITQADKLQRRIIYFKNNLDQIYNSEFDEKYGLPNEDAPFVSYSFEGTKLKVPAFIAKGSVTKSDVEPGDFSFVDPDRHIYWLGPKRVNSKIEFEVRTLSHERFREKALSSLSVGINSTLDLMMIDSKNSGLKILGGVKDQDGITLSGLSIDVSSIEATPVVNSIGFERPLDKNGILLPIASSKGDVLFVSSPKPSNISLYSINGIVTRFQKMTPLGDFEVNAPDAFIDIPLIYKKEAGVDLWIRSTAKLFLSDAYQRRDSINLQKSVKLEFVSSNAAVAVEGNSFYIISNRGGKLVSPLTSSFASEDCSYVGSSTNSILFSCLKGSSSQLFSFSHSSN